MPRLAHGALEALASARHADPFSILGPHTDGEALVVRAYQPAASDVDVVRTADRSTTRMTRVHPSGIFEAVFRPATDAFDYRLRVTYPGGYVSEIDDPYRYGRVITDFDLYLFGEGKHTRIYDRLGAHLTRLGETAGAHFAVWAPNAERVSVVGDFNGWDGRVHPMRSLGASGVWEIFIPGIPDGQRYKFEIRSRASGELLLKTDPYGFRFEIPPRS
ncbi:MAG TPA: hypothetical protein VGL62_12075, partial [Vicinamibacterales bacterium]